MSDLLLDLIKALIVVSIVLVTRYFIPWLKEKVEASKYAWVVKWAQTAVDAMQQTGDKISNAEKKAKVVELLQELLIKKNISISDKELDAIIEAAVWAMKKAKRES